MTDDELKLLAAIETAFMGRMVELEKARQRRLGRRTAGHTDRAAWWCESADEEDDEDTLAALVAFPPTAWWRDKGL